MKHISLLIVVLSLMSSVFGQSPSRNLPRPEVIDSQQLLRDLKILSADDMEGRKPDTPGSAKARAYIAMRFEESGLKPLGKFYTQDFTFSFKGESKLHKGTNLIGHLKGQVHPERYLIVTAHYDHLGVKGGRIYNGADDNGSGTAALFALAEFFKTHRPSNSIIFVAFDAEESVRKGGSFNFLANCPVKLESIVVNVNLDMIGLDQRNILYAVGTYHYPFLKPYLAEVASTSNIYLVFGHDDPDEKYGQEDWTDESDHIHFHIHKIPFIYFGVEDKQHHHRPTDVYENINPVFYVGAVATIVEAVKQFDDHLSQIEAEKALLQANTGR